MTTPRLLALSDLHVAHPQNREIVAALPPGRCRGLAAAGRGRGGAVPRHRVGAADPGGQVRHRRVDPGESRAVDAAQGPGPLRGEERYLALVELCRGLGIRTPEDPYPVWHGPGRPGHGRAGVPAVRLHVPAGRRADQGAGPQDGVREGHRVPRRGAAAPRSRTRPGKNGAGPGSRPPSAGSPRGTRRSRSSSSRTTRWSASPPGSCATRCSRSGAVPRGPATGTCVSTPPRSSTATCTSRG